MQSKVGCLKCCKVVLPKRNVRISVICPTTQQTMIISPSCMMLLSHSTLHKQVIHTLSKRIHDPHIVSLREKVTKWDGSEVSRRQQGTFT